MDCVHDIEGMDNIIVCSTVLREAAEAILDGCNTSINATRDIHHGQFIWRKNTL
jgi:hypothetical protein